MLQIQRTFRLTSTRLSLLTRCSRPHRYSNNHHHILRFFQVSTINEFQLGRRRIPKKTAVIENDQNNNKSREATLPLNTIVTDSEEFGTASNALINKLMNALSPLKEFNDPFVLTCGIEEDMGYFILLDLGPTLGQYNIQIDLDENVLLLRSPISGQIVYNLTRGGDWCSIDDGHNFEGMFVRDLIKQIKGVPNL